ncbi:hypothetical protein DPMN_007287 [Dreissena polymorpha]|uniref:Uncharacterized protein n=1 Tax=Dreissena polymorpha TaxID=45954 RepID=A0A9D4MY79_DREPO|nr:hypothetical protein DPMN_007287 [Dreissena polymorpha]
MVPVRCQFSWKGLRVSCEFGTGPPANTVGALRRDLTGSLTHGGGYVTYEFTAV